jgi:ubiquinone biosynthesis protein COQ9
MTPSPDLTLDELRKLLAPAIADAAVFDGWSAAAVATAAGEHGIDPGIAALAFSAGPMAMIAEWIHTVDAAMEQAFAGNALVEVPSVNVSGSW